NRGKLRCACGCKPESRMARSPRTARAPRNLSWRIQFATLAFLQGGRNRIGGKSFGGDNTHADNGVLCWARRELSLWPKSGNAGEDCWRPSFPHDSQKFVRDESRAFRQARETAPSSRGPRFRFVPRSWWTRSGHDAEKST